MIFFAIATCDSLQNGSTPYGEFKTQYSYQEFQWCFQKLNSQLFKVTPGKTFLNLWNQMNSGIVP
jgi:hypothetical protein